MAISFERLYEAALRHRGCDSEQLESLLTTAADPKALAAIPDARWLSAASKAVFSAGFNWSVVAKKWPAHEEAFANLIPMCCSVGQMIGWMNWSVTQVSFAMAQKSAVCLKTRGSFMICRASMVPWGHIWPHRHRISTLICLPR